MKGKTMSDLMLDVGQANELKLAFRREGNWTPETIKRLSDTEGLLRQVLGVIEGRSEIKPVPLLKPIAEVTLQLQATEAKKTADCFKNEKRFYYRDSDLDSWFPDEQVAGKEKNPISKGLTRQAFFVEVAKAILGQDQEGKVRDLAEGLKDRGYTVTLPKIEDLIERTEKGEDIGLQTNGHFNFFFVEDKNGVASVVGVSRREGRWGVLVLRLGDGRRWVVESRFFS